MAQENSSMEMGASDQVLVANKKRRTLQYIIGGGIFLVIVAVVVTLAVVLTRDDGNDVTDPTEPYPDTTPITETDPTPTIDPGPTPTPDPDPTTTPDPGIPECTSTPDPEPTSTPDPTPTTDPVPTPAPEPDIEEELDMDLIIDGSFSPSSFNATWTAANLLMYQDSYGNLLSYDIDTNEPEILIANTSTVLQQSSRVIELNADQDMIVLAHNVEPVYRHSFLGRYTVVHVDSGNETEIGPPSPPTVGRSGDGVFLQNFVWGPTGSALAFVYVNNIYYQTSLTSAPQVITTTGREDVIYHGIPDWVYEEEVFGSNNAMWFSQDGSKLAWATFDDTDVRKMRVPHYGVPGSVEHQYTYHHEIRYPKPGTINPTVRVTLRDLAGGNETVYDAPYATLTEPILKRVQFVNDETIAIMWTNRVQNEMIVNLCPFNGICVTIYEYRENDGWIDNIPLIFNSQGNAFITILPQTISGRRYKQIVQVSTNAPLWQASDRTNTAHTVSEILLWTDDDDIWYKATHVDDSAQQHIYTVNAERNVTCFSCDFVRDDGESCLYNEATISQGGSRIALNCAGPEIPQTYILDANGTVVRTWDTNTELTSLVSNRRLPVTLNINVPLAANLPPANVRLQLPPDYLSRTNIPMLVYVYGGPDTALITRRWNIDWGMSLVSRWNISIAHIDGRGSGLRGVENLFVLNRGLGTIEIEDQIEAARFLQNSFNFIDRDRTCIWGWSYGGYAASLALARGGDVFSCAIAVAPVVDWHFYDTIYTERYMDVPLNNTAGYAASTLLDPSVAEAYRNKRYMLIHGTEDDNVHFQHAMLISRMLQRSDVQFTQMAYTDEAHGLVGVSPHLYNGMEKFLEENLLSYTPTPEPDPTSTPEPDPTSTLGPDPTSTPDPEPTSTPDPDPTSTPDPDPTSTPDPDPTSTPEPDPTSTPDPEPTSTPGPDPTSTPDPEPTSTPDPDPTSTPDPDPTSTPDPDPTSTPDPEPTSTPDPTPTTDPVPTPAPEPDIEEELDMDLIIDGSFSPSSFNATWTAENELMFRDSYGNLLSYDIDTNEPEILIANTSTVLQQSSRVIELNADQDMIVLAHNVQQVYRHSFLGRYTVVDVDSGNETEIGPPSPPTVGRSGDGVFLQNFVWGPTGSALAFVYVNNIYYQSSLTSAPQVITTTGREDVIYHGIPDWVYEEEVFGSNNAMWFSQDGSKLAWATFDDTDVRKMRVPHYGVPGSVEHQYTYHHENRYPKPGTINPTVRVTLRDLAGGIETAYEAPYATLTEPILKRVQFVNNETIAIIWTNRVQNEMIVNLCPFNGICATIYEYRENDGWIDNIPLIFNSQGNAFITILPQTVSGRRYKQIVQVSTNAPLWQATDRTNTAHTVSEILLWTDDDDIWYKATHVDDSAQQHIYTVNAERNVTCFSCDFVREDGAPCLYNEATISQGGSRIALNCAGPEIPQTYILDANRTVVRTWDTNTELTSLVSNRRLPVTLNVNVPLATNLPPANVRLQLPPDYLNRTNIPMLVYVYGGPDTALITRRWNIDWGMSLVSRWNISIAHIDGRGSGLRGVENLFVLNRGLGTVEIEDQIEATRFLQNSFNFIDRDRTCIWGWSYGGYAASLALARGGDVFRCAIAVAPVVDWHFYDTIYTERYMDVPLNNTAGYAASTLLDPSVAEAYRNKRYMLIHGTEDDNVHFQHAMLISRMLQRSDVQFTQMAYTDEAHGLAGVSPHLYDGMEEFLEENLL